MLDVVCLSYLYSWMIGKGGPQGHDCSKNRLVPDEHCEAIRFF